MRQALHIFTKDIRYLRLEIGLFAALSAIFAWAGTHASSSKGLIQSLLMLASVYLITRLIHAEAIPGDKQFWVTRPYDWRSLLGAKLLFILVVVNLPVLAVRLVILIGGGFPLLPNVPGLLGSQLLITIASFLPAAQLASLTSGIVQCILVAVGGVAVMIVAVGELDDFFLLPRSVAWVRLAIALGAALVVASSVLVLQYRNRRTFVSWILVIGATAFALIGVRYFPPAAELGMQSRLSRQASESAPVHAAIDPRVRKTVVIPGGLVPPGVGAEVIQLTVPFVIGGVPEGREVLVDALGLTFEGADGQTRKFDLTGVVDSRLQDNVYPANVFIESSFFNPNRERPLRVLASIYLTIFGNAEQKTFPLQDVPVNVTDGLQFYSRSGRVYFRTAFRSPANLVYATIGRFTSSVGRFVSYSPFPAEPRALDPLEESAFGPPPSGSGVTITSMEPLAHFRRDAESNDFRLADFVVGSN